MTNTLQCQLLCTLAVLLIGCMQVNANGADDCLLATKVKLSTYSDDGSTLTATPTPGLPALCGTTQLSNDVWYVLTTLTSGVLNVSTCGSALDTVVSAHVACPSSQFTYSVACNDNSCGTGSSISLSVDGPQAVYIRVGGQNGVAGNFTIQMTYSGMVNNCTSGTFGLALGSNAPSCASCSAGEYSSDAALSCTRCNFGTYSNSSGATTCKYCPPGTFALQNGATRCDDCAPGFYTSNVGSPYCLACPAGMFAASNGSSQCTPCPQGQYSNSLESTTCHNCPAGTYADHYGSTACVFCEPGTFQNQSAQPSCLACPINTYSSPANSNKTYCTPCGPGSYTIEPRSTSCAVCPVGKTLQGEGNTLVCASSAFSIRVTLWSVVLLSCLASFFWL